MCKPDDRAADWWCDFSAWFELICPLLRSLYSSLVAPLPSLCLSLDEFSTSKFCGILDFSDDGFFVEAGMIRSTDSWSRNSNKVTVSTGTNECSAHACQSFISGIDQRRGLRAYRIVLVAATRLVQ